MEVWRTTVVLLSRRRTMAALLALSLCAGAAAFVLVPTRYVSKSIVVLTAPATGAAIGAGSPRSGRSNPLLGFDQSLLTTASLEVQIMSTPDMAEQVGAGKRSKTKVTVTDANGAPELFGASGPFLLVKAVSSASSAAAVNTVETTVEMIRSDLADRQQALNAPASTFLVVADVVTPTRPEVDVLAKVKAAAGAGIVGFVIALAAAYAAHRLWERKEFEATVPRPTSNGQPLPTPGRKVVPRPSPVARRGTS